MNSRSLVGLFFLDMSILKLALNINQSINGYVNSKVGIKHQSINGYDNVKL